MYTYYQHSPLAALRRARYGRSSEQLDESIYQLELMLEDFGASVGERTESEVLPEPLEPAQPLGDQLKPRIPEHLPRTERVHEVNPRCECCGEALKIFAQDSSERLSMCQLRFE